MKILDSEIFASFFGFSVGVVVVGVGRNIIWWGYTPCLVMAVYTLYRFIKEKRS